ncbi:MAG: ROK family transcriptional regulator [Ktedonobacterales bacterium]|nr:ROK family transcriptional regulator [Ktedonobacterales bacterium]
MQSGVNLHLVRDYNQGVILEAIRVEGGISRVALAQKTGLTAQTVTNIVRRLLDQDMILEIGRDVAAIGSTGGKPRVRLSINPAAGYAIGIQIDRDLISLIIVDLNGTLIAKAHLPMQQDHGPIAIIAEIAEAVRRLIQQSQIPSAKIIGIGVACPGPLDHDKGIVFAPPNLLGWDEVPIRDLLMQHLGYPVIVDNDATAAAIGVRWLGGAHFVSNFAFIYMGVGLGCGMFIDNHIYRGSTTNAGELGHITLNPDGPACYCGNRGCVELYCSPQAMVQAYAAHMRDKHAIGTLAHPSPPLTFVEIAQAAMGSDPVARAIVNQSAQALAQGVVSLVNIFDPELIVLGGKGFHTIGPIYRETIQQALRDHSFARRRHAIKVELAVEGESAAALGAATLILYEAFTLRMNTLTTTP